MNRKTLLIFLAILIPIVCFSQKLKKYQGIAIKKTKTDSEIYYDSKSDKSLKHGPYLKKNSKGDLWKEGQFHQGLKSGIWKYYNHKNELVQKFNFDKQEFMLRKNENPKKRYAIIGDDEKVTTELLDSEPTVLGGLSVIYEHFYQNFQMPQPYGPDDYKFVFVIYVNEKGECHKVAQVMDLPPHINKVGLAVMEKLKDFEFFSAIFNGKPVSVAFPLEFEVGPVSTSTQSYSTPSPTRH